MEQIVHGAAIHVTRSDEEWVNRCPGICDRVVALSSSKVSARVRRKPATRDIEQSVENAGRTIKAANCHRSDSGPCVGRYVISFHSCDCCTGCACAACDKYCIADQATVSAVTHCRDIQASCPGASRNVVDLG